MAEKLRRKFIVFSVGAVLIVLVIIASFINILNYIHVEERADELLAILTDNNGYFPKPTDYRPEYNQAKKLSPEAPFSTRFFTVKIDNNGGFIAVDTGKISSVSRERAFEYAADVIERGRESGFADSYKYRLTDKQYGVLVTFVDCSKDLQLFYSFLQSSVITCIVGIVAVFILVFIFSKKVVSPVSESYEKQKQFITNASHELKTPLAIITSNADVVDMDYGENEWTEGIRRQAMKLSQLVDGLIALTRMDEEKSQLVKTEFSLSDAVVETAESFSTLVESRGRKMELKVEKSISYCGNEESIRRLVGILMDNATKYATENTLITLSLKTQGRKIILKVGNETSGLKVGNYNTLFERFYRIDNSRNSSIGGYGIGLSIAKAIVIGHNGKITANSSDGKTIFFTVEV